jgi:hypothetical protein
MSANKASGPVDVPYLVIKIADALGDGWTVEPGNQSSGEDKYLVHPEHGRFYVAREGSTLAKRNRVTITGVMPDGYLKYSSAEAAKRTVAAGHGAAAAVKAFRSGLLDEHAKAVAVAREGIAGYQRDARARDETVAMLLGVFGDGLRVWAVAGRKTTLEDTVELSLTEGSGRIYVRPGGRVILHDVEIPAALLNQAVVAVSAFVRGERQS